MCGIAGYIGSKNINDVNIQRTLNLMKNRGPDSQKFESQDINNNRLLFLHSRLSIIDLDERSNQPFEKDDLIIIFNGEIYNFLEIKKNLIKKGHRFRTNSDTEVIIEAYKKYKENCVNIFEGMWAFVIFDKKEKIVFFSRDRFGEKPLYLLEIGDEIYFGSETKFIVSLLGNHVDLNYDKINKFLVCGFRSLFKERSSFFSGIRELPPSTNLVVKNNFKKNEYKYWSLNYRPKKINETEVFEKVEELLFNSVKLRLRSDIPLAFCLSGGIDSSSLVAITNKLINSKIQTFSIIDSDERYNESENINEIVSFIECENTIISTTRNDFINNMEKIISYYSAPIPTISYYIHNQLSELIKQQGYSVVISGTGADEIFTGYYDHYLFWLYEMRLDSNFKQLIEEMKDGYGSYINNPLLKDPIKIIDDPSFRGHLYQSSDVFKKIVRKKIERSFNEQSFCEDILRNRMLNELSEEVVPVILFSDDLNSMMYSIENRSPFLDKNLVEFLFTIETKFLIKDGFQKYLLRNCSKNLLPKSILQSKKKIGFNASINSLMDLTKKKNIDWLLSDSDIFEIVRKDKMENILKSDFSKNDYSKFLFAFISSKIFIDQQKKKLNG